MKYGGGLLLLVLVGTVQAATPLERAMSWLALNQNADGSWGNAACWEPVCTPFAAWATYNAHGNSSNTSSNVSAALAWMKADLQNNESWSWAEADLPGLELLAVATTGNYSELNTTTVSARLLGMQESESGGFRGWSVFNGTDWVTIADSVDTGYALRGLLASGTIHESNASAAASYLLSLQNADGSFNHSSNLSETSFSSLAPDVRSTTALALFALNEQGIPVGNASVQSAIAYLKNQTGTCKLIASNVTMGDSATFGLNANTSYTYSAALSSLAFAAFNETEWANRTAAYLQLVQRQEGGFLDGRRIGNASNALDTGIAALAMQSTGVDVTSTSFSATVTAPNGTNYSVSVAYNLSTARFEANFNETTVPGTYTVNANVEACYNASLAAEFQAVTPNLLPISNVTTGQSVSVIAQNLSANGDASANVTLPNATNYAVNLTYNNAAKRFEAIFNETGSTGTYFVNVTARAYGNTFYLTATFGVTAPAPTPTPSPTTNPLPDNTAGNDPFNAYPTATPSPTPRPTPVPTPTPAFQFNQLAQGTPTPSGTPEPMLAKSVSATSAATPTNTLVPTVSATRPTGLFALLLNPVVGAAMGGMILIGFGYYQLRKRNQV